MGSWVYPTCCLTDWQATEGGRYWTGISHPHPRPSQFRGAGTSEAKSTPPIRSPGENPSAASGRLLAASLLSVSWEPARAGRRWVAPEGASAPHLLPVDSGSFPGTPLSSLPGTWHPLSRRLSFSRALQTPARTHCQLPSAPPGNLTFQAPETRKSRLARPHRLAARGAPPAGLTSFCQDPERCASQNEEQNWHLPHFS